MGVLIPTLTRWGHSPDADIAYRALVLRGAMTVDALAHDLEVPVRRIRQALAELHDIDAVSVDAQSKWRASAPPVVAARLNAGSRRRFDAQEQSRRHSQLAGRLIASHTMQLGQGIRHIPTRALVRQRLAELATIERHEHLAMNTEQSIEPSAAQAAIPIHRTVLARGVAARIIGPPALDRGIQSAAFDELHRLPFEARETWQVPLKLFVIDRRVALFPLVPHDFEQGYLEISQVPIVQALHAEFERVWASASPPQEQAMVPIHLSPRENAVVGLLAQGHTDASAARELHIGVRTVTTILRGLMDRLEVSNRFQLGLALGAMRAARPDVTVEEEQ